MIDSDELSPEIHVIQYTHELASNWFPGALIVMYFVIHVRGLRERSLRAFDRH
jgi:hypothetical protein